MNAGGGVRAGHPSRTAVTGPLAPYADGFREDLGGQGYALHSISGQMGLMAHLSAWLERQDLPVGGLTVEVVEGYLRVRRGAGHWTGITGRAVAPLMGYLRGLRVVAEPVRQVPGTPVEVVLEEFRVYLVDERGLAPASVYSYLRYARMFVTGLSAPLGTALAELSAGQVTVFLVSQSGLRSTWYAKAMVTALRSLLRFLHTAGHIPHPLVGAVPSVPGWKLTTLPRSVNADEVAAVLAGCDRDSAKRRRDYAILLLLARLGLRAGEVSAIELDDINWRAGELVVRGKGNRVEVLPLTLPSPVWGPKAPSSRWSSGPASAPVSPGLGLTGCVTRWPVICSGTGLRWPRSARCCGTATNARPRSTPTLGNCIRRARTCRSPGRHGSAVEFLAGGARASDLPI